MECKQVQSGYELRYGGRMDYTEFLNLPMLPTGRRLFTHKKVVERAEPKLMRDIVEHAKKAIAHDEETLRIELSRQGASTSRFGAEAMRLDVLLDRAVTGLDAFFESFIRICGAEHDQGAAAAALREAVFPAGVGTITSLPYIQEDEAVGAVLARLAEADMKQHLARLPGVDGLIDIIAARQTEYHAELHKEDDRPSKQDMYEMQYRGNANLQGTIILILAYEVRTGDDEGAGHLLDVARRQVQDVREARRRRRPAVDVNPDTGEPTTPDNDAPAGDSNEPEQ